VANATNGTVSLQSDGHTVRFTPTANYVGTGSFSFTVKGSDGTTYTGIVSMLVEPGSSVGIQPMVRPQGSYELSVSSRVMTSNSQILYQAPADGASLALFNLAGAIVSRKELSNRVGTMSFGEWGVSLQSGSYVLAMVNEGSIRATAMVYKPD